MAPRGGHRARCSVSNRGRMGQTIHLRGSLRGLHGIDPLKTLLATHPGQSALAVAVIPTIKPSPTFGLCPCAYGAGACVAVPIHSSIPFGWGTLGGVQARAFAGGRHEAEILRCQVIS